MAMPDLLEYFIAMSALCRVGLIRPSVEVRFENLTAEASVHTNTSRNLPSVLNAYLNIAEVGSFPATFYDNVHLQTSFLKYVIKNQGSR